MPKGGHSRSGPAPDPNALRRDRDKAEWIRLPASREGDPPDWPLTRPTRRELDLWVREWHRPQAIVWEANGQATEVAIFVRSLAVAEKPKATIAARTLVRQQMDALGLTVPGLRSNRWVIDDGSPAPHKKQPPAAAGEPSARERLSLIAG